jgi:hypothetical protein
MKVSELEKKLQNDGFDRRGYSFSRTSPPIEGYILEKVDDYWIVFSTDRGYFVQVANFISEVDACDYFYQKMHEEYGSTIRKNVQ